MSDRRSAVGIADAPLLTASPTAPRRCVACGYPRIGLSDIAVCPECGHDPIDVPLPSAQMATDAWWARSVLAGLVLLGVSTFVMLGVTLYMRYRGDWGGSLPILNYPGPKVWGSALLQRSIGSAPGEWGVAGTRFGLLALLGIWFITAPRPAERLEEATFSLRRLCRWGTLLLSGGVLGVLLGEDGVAAWNEAERDGFHLLLLSMVELPAAMLLYLYLLRLSRPLGDRQLVKSLQVLAIAVPVCVAVAVVFLLTGEFWRDHKHGLPQLILLGAYGAACVGLGALGTATIGRLAIGLLPAAAGNTFKTPSIPSFARLTGWWHSLAGSPNRLTRLCIAGGLVGWLLASIAALGDVLMLDLREGYGGNWPMLNVPGPKVWAVPLAGRFEDGGWAYWSEGDGNALIHVLFVALCLWPITLHGLREREHEARVSLRRATRWVPALLLGLAIGVIVGFDGHGRFPLLNAMSAHTMASAITLPLTMFVEAPATLLLYLYLARIAQTIGRPGLERQLSWVGITMTTLILAGNGFFAASQMLPRELRRELVVNLPIALYGAAAVVVGLWATWCVLTLTRALVAPSSVAADATTIATAPAAPPRPVP